MKKENNDFFWPSYVDLLTGLFIVMLVLFVLSFKSLSDSKRIIEEKFIKIQEIQNAVSSLPPELFQYQPEFKRFTLNRQIQFKIGRSEIPFKDYDYLTKAGNEIKSMISELKYKFAQDSIKYLIVIEGMASIIGGTRASNYELSYDRAKAVYDFWTNVKNIKFDPSVCEIMISGSGTGGVGRYSGSEEYKNQRILIQIIPKISYQGNIISNKSIKYDDRENTVQMSSSPNEDLSSNKKKQIKAIKYQSQIYSYPSSSRVTIDGKYYGLSPLNIELVAGNHPLIVRKDGYNDIVTSIDIDSLKNNSFNFILNRRIR